MFLPLNQNIHTTSCSHAFVVIMLLEHAENRRCIICMRVLNLVSLMTVERGLVSCPDDFSSCVDCVLDRWGRVRKSDRSRQASCHAYQNSRTSRICSLHESLQRIFNEPLISSALCARVRVYIARTLHGSLSRLLSPRTLP